MYLGIESSCDETAIALIDGKRIVGHVVHTQDHSEFGGVMPQVAAREHVVKLPLVMKAVLDKGQCTIGDIRAVGVTAGPGLVGGLLAGVAFARGLACGAGIPVYPIHHLEAHALMVRMEHDVAFPYVLVLISGGHCMVVNVRGVGHYDVLGQTYDDAVGECLDKVARCLGGGYPGGPFIEKMAKMGDDTAVKLPVPLRNDDTCNFSFSGLKTACLLHIQSWADGAMPIQDQYNLCASLQRVVADSICAKVTKALAMTGAVRCVVSGGVASNAYFRQRFSSMCMGSGVSFYAPSVSLCTDNGVMIAWALHENIHAGYQPSTSFPVRARWPLTDLAGPL